MSDAAATLRLHLHEPFLSQVRMFLDVHPQAIGGSLRNCVLLATEEHNAL